MTVEPIWLEPNDIVRINQREVAETHEPFGLMDRGLLESAVYNPVNRYVYNGERNIVVLCAELMIALARNHPFQQGNKRTAFGAAAVFLVMNGYTFVDDDLTIAAGLIGVVDHQITDAQFIALLARFIAPIRPDPIRRRAWLWRRGPKGTRSARRSRR